MSWLQELSLVNKGTIFVIVSARYGGPAHGVQLHAADCTYTTTHNIYIYMMV